MQTQELGNAIVRLCEERRGIEAVSRFYANDVISNEAPGTAVELRSEGKASVLAKNQWWYENHEIHELTARGPFSGANDQFAILFEIDVTQSGSGERIRISEVGVYKARDGQIVEETFLYG